MLKGEKVYLRLMELKDVSYKVQWINDDKVRETLNFDYPVSVVNTENWVRNTANKGARKDFIICNIINNEPIGYAGLLNIDVSNKKTESYMGIGNTQFWGQGVGKEVKYLLTEYAFDYLNLNKVYSFHHDDNLVMIKINEKLGGKVEGILREDLYLPGGIVKDKIIISILRDEFIRKI